MKCFERSLTLNLPVVEQVRLLNCGARLMDVYQNGMLVHHKMRHGATQTVIVRQQVQHVQVNDRGRALPLRRNLRSHHCLAQLSKQQTIRRLDGASIAMRRQPT